MHRPALLLSLLLSSTALAQDAAVPASGTSRVHVTSTKPELTLAVVKGTGVGSAGGYTVTSTYYEDLCMAPCAADLPAGLYTFMAYGPGITPVSRKVDLRQETTLDVTAGSAGLRTGGYLIAATGLTALVMGGMFYALDSTEDDPTYRLWDPKSELMVAGLGVAGTVGGVVMMRAGRSAMDLRTGTP